MRPRVFPVRKEQKDHPEDSCPLQVTSGRAADSGHHARHPLRTVAVALAIQPRFAAKPGLADVSKVVWDGGPGAGRGISGRNV